MPWEERNAMSEREKFVVEVLQAEESMCALCRRYGITRKTGYKWLERARGGEGLEDQSRAPQKVRNRTAPEMEELILSAREEHPYWGPRKLKRYLQDKGYTDLPCKSTIGNILKRNGRIEPEASQTHQPYRRFERGVPNELWQMDYKGDFGMLDGRRCYPLTILDDHSRFSLCLQAEEGINYSRFQPKLERVFKEYGLPRELLCDNGKPWGDSKGSITAFDVWMMRLGILPIHGRPIHPQTQGKEERFHRTLKTELLKGRLITDLDDAQRAFDLWRYEYNHERPHDALALDAPVKHYRPSPRPFIPDPPEPEYPSGVRLRRVNYKGYISINQHRYYLTEALAGSYLQLLDTEQDTLALLYGPFQVTRIDLEEKVIISKHIYRAP